MQTHESNERQNNLAGQSPPCTGTSGNGNHRLCNLLEGSFVPTHFLSFSSHTSFADVNYLQVNARNALCHGWIFP